jgi:tetratricopeptide (TPR) repeat protein
MRDTQSNQHEIQNWINSGQFAQAEQALRQLLSSGSGPIHHWKQLALALKKQGKHQEAADVQSMLVEHIPGDLSMRYDLAESLLLLGQFARGWKEYRYRYSLPHTRRIERKVQKPRWNGRPILGKTLLVFDEQGFGDSFQFIRLVAWAKKYSQARIILEVNPESLSLYQRCIHADQIIPRGTLIPDFDCYCELMTLPDILGLQVEHLPVSTHYLTADTDRVAFWKEKLAPIPGPRVALVWAGRSDHLNDHNRSISLNHLSPLAIPGIQFLALQKGPASSQTSHPPEGMALHSLSDQINSFEDTAAILTLVDLLISVDSSPAHLAGALGCPTWVMLPFLPEWRWQTDRADTPWYPEAKLFRQSAAGDWNSVTSRMATELRNLVT